MKLACMCGCVISTVEYPNPVEGSLYGVESLEEFEPKTGEAIVAYFEAKAKNQKAEWLAAHFSKDYPRDLPDASVIYDLITAARRGHRHHVLECPSCGRLLVQEKSGVNRYRSYLPEKSHPRILKKNA